MAKTSPRTLATKELAIIAQHNLTFPFHFSLFHQLNGRHFEKVEMNEVETQVALNTHTEHDFQDAFKNGRSAWSGAYVQKGITVKVMVAKVVRS
jgi:DUF1365 family protein